MEKDDLIQNIVCDVKNMREVNEDFMHMLGVVDNEIILEALDQTMLNYKETKTIATSYVVYHQPYN